MIKYSKFTDNIGSENLTNTFSQSIDKCQKVCMCVCVGGMQIDRGDIYSFYTKTHTSDEVKYCSIPMNIQTQQENTKENTK